MKRIFFGPTGILPKLITITALSILVCLPTIGQEVSTKDGNAIARFGAHPSHRGGPETERVRIVTGKNNVLGNDVQPSAVKSDNDQNAIIGALERRAFDILNQKRATNGLELLKWNDGIARIARLHSSEMAEFQYFSHTGRKGDMVSDRADRLGFADWSAIGENIAFNRGYEKPAEIACETWMNSQSHKENILDVRWKEAGIGLAIGADGSYYFTEVFVLR